MLSFPPAVRIWLALAPADLRKGFDALASVPHPRWLPSLDQSEIDVGERAARGAIALSSVCKGDRFVLHPVTQSVRPADSVAFCKGSRRHRTSIGYALKIFA
jgi:hypothetical protein